MKRHACLFSAISLILGCAGPTSLIANLYPVEGPLFNAKDVSPIPIVASGVGRYGGSLNASLPHGGICSGQWSLASERNLSTTSGTLFSKYGSVYGSATTVSSGGQPAQGVGILTCDDGTMIQVEFETGVGTQSGFGFAEDNRGNVYRVLF